MATEWNEFILKDTSQLTVHSGFPTVAFVTTEKCFFRRSFCDNNHDIGLL